MRRFLLGCRGCNHGDAGHHLPAKAAPTLKGRSTRRRLTITIACGGPSCAAEPSIKPRLVAAALLGSRKVAAGRKKTIKLRYKKRLRRRQAVKVTVRFKYGTGGTITRTVKVRSK